MAAAYPYPSGGGPGGGLLLGTALAGILGVLYLWRRSHRVALAAGLVVLGTLMILSPLPLAGEGRVGAVLPSRSGDLQSPSPSGGSQTLKPVLGERFLHPATGALTPYRLRIPSLQIDTLIEPAGITRSGLMDVPRNLSNAAWLKTGARPGARGQAVIDGHLDSVAGPALFGELHRLKPGDTIYVSDAGGAELTFAVTAVEVEPLRGFPTLRVFGPASGRFLNLITCAGTYDPTGHTYDHRLVVFTQLA
jgi:hypothetical protein